MSEWSPSAVELDRRAVRRRQRLRSAAIASVATVVLLGALAVLIVTSPGWPRFQATFLSWSDAKAAFPSVIAGRGNARPRDRVRSPGFGTNEPAFCSHHAWKSLSFPRTLSTS